MFWKTEETPKIYLTALCAWREARGAGDDAILGVLCTIRNRVLKPSWWGKDYPSVVLKAKQFSSFDSDDPNAVKLPGPDDAVFARILTLTEGVVSGQTPDNTGGATNYHDASVFPNWAQELKPCATIGPFRFYR